jgi:hypothetical protein
VAILWFNLIEFHETLGSELLCSALLALCDATFLMLLKILRLLKDLLVDLIPINRRIPMLCQHQNQSYLQLGLEGYLKLLNSERNDIFELELLIKKLTNRRSPVRPASFRALLFWILKLLAKRFAGFFIDPTEHLVDFAPPASLNGIGVTHGIIRNAHFFAVFLSVAILWKFRLVH